MSLLLNRSLFYFTLASYLLVGSVGLRLISSSEQVSLNLPSLSLLTEAPVAASSFELVAPELEFAEVAASAPIVRSKSAKVVAPHKVAAPIQPKLDTVKLSKHELPFSEPVKLSPIDFRNHLNTNLAGLFKELPISNPETLMADSNVGPVSDEVSVVQSGVQDSDAEPEFFDYSQDAAQQSGTGSEVLNAAVISDVAHFNEVKDFVAQEKSGSAVAVEKVGIDDMMSLGYAGGGKPLSSQAPQISLIEKPRVGKATTGIHSSTPGQPENQGEVTDSFISTEESEPAAFAALDIQLVGTDLLTTQRLTGFDLTFQDDYSIVRDDRGVARIRESVATELSTRSVKIEKSGFIPTNTDLILQSTNSAISMSLPVIADEKFSELLEESKERGPTGAVLVKLHDSSDTVSLDVTYGRLYNLDAGLRVTEKEDFEYVLFVGVQPGNAVLSYLKGEESVNKVIHVHKWELTFDSNFYESDPNPTVSLFEEDLLAKEKSPLIVAADQVRSFVSFKPSTKVDDHTYRVDSGSHALGTRKYIELSHLEETLFVGVRNSGAVSVPSENFMRFILSRFEGSQLGDRCMIQVNLSKRAVSFAVGSESTSGALMTYAQMLDTDGKFYDSIGEKTRKIIVLGENQGSPHLNPNSKINMKITYADGSEQFLGAFCSPNTYFVEQL